MAATNEHLPSKTSAARMAAHILGRIAIVIVTAAALTAYIRFVFPGFPGQVYPVVIAMVAVLSWRFGAVTASFALLVTAGMIDWFVLDGNGLAIAKPEQAAGLGILLAVGAAMIWSMDRLRLERGRRQQRIAELELRLEGRRHQVEELVHRIRNDLSGLASVAQVYGRKPDPTEAVEAIVDRITVLGRLYQRLNIPENGDAMIDMRGFLQGVLSDLRDSHIGIRPITVKLFADQVVLPVKTAAVVALTVNEAVTNACKYAWADDEPGEIKVALTHQGDRMLLEIADDGIGPDGGPAKGTGMGTRLMRAMAAQIAGRHAIRRDKDHTVVEMEFPAT